MQLLLPPDRESATIRIVGQGLAGSALALSLIEHGYSVCVYDNDYRTSSSMIAAGMWNPLSFVNLKRAWLTHLLLPAMEETYPRFESLLQASFYHPLPLLRIFPDAGAANTWEEKSIHPEVAPYLDASTISESEVHFHQPHGHGVVKGAGWLDMPIFLNATRTFLEKRNAYVQAEITVEHMKSWLHKGDWVVQCTGWKPMQDSFWSAVPIHTNKGQVLTMRIDGLSEEYLSNFGKFTIPLGGSHFRVGSTYEHGALDMQPSEAANEIKEDVEKSVKHAFAVIDHKAGFRPTTIDRQPVLGVHNQYNRLAIFNGFGSRGVMLVPFFAEQLINYLTKGLPIMKEVDWQRFEKRRSRHH
jgi:glycine/D-amino acid oxidase-like deaminating enzyme